MDNLTRTAKELARMQLDYLRALKQELELSGEKLLSKLD